MSVMDAMLYNELSKKDQTALRQLISVCNQEDGTNYDTEPDADFYYIIRNEDKEGSACDANIISVLSGYLLGETLDGGKVLELEAFTHPALRRLGYFSLCFNSLRDDFRSYRFRFSVKSMDPESGTICEDTMQVLKALHAGHLYDELMMLKHLPGGISNPGDTISTDYGEMHFSPYNAHTLYLYGVLVYDRYLRQGHGRELMELAEKVPAGPYTELMLQVSSDNQIAYHLYESMGYRIIDRMNYYLLPQA